MRTEIKIRQKILKNHQKIFSPTREIQNFENMRKIPDKIKKPIKYKPKKAKVIQCLLRVIMFFSHSWRESEGVFFSIGVRKFSDFFDLKIFSISFH